MPRNLIIELTSGNTSKIWLVVISTEQIARISLLIKNDFSRDLLKIIYTDHLVCANRIEPSFNKTHEV